MPTGTQFDQLFAKQVRKAVKASGQELKDIARRGAFEPRELQAYMDGTRRPILERMFDLADALEVNPDFFRGR